MEKTKPLSIFILLLFLLSCKGQNKKSDFALLNKSDAWDLVFDDTCTNDWEKNWFLDGLMANVENTPEGMHFLAGPEARNDAHHAVLWTKESISGDIKIEYDYKGYIKPGQKYHVTAIKSGTKLHFNMESVGGEELFSWDLSNVANVKEGRIGLRHMCTRSAIYKNFKVYTKKK